MPLIQMCIMKAHLDCHLQAAHCAPTMAMETEISNACIRCWVSTALPEAECVTVTRAPRSADIRSLSGLRWC
jgi:hypothetical protein